MIIPTGKKTDTDKREPVERHTIPAINLEEEFKQKARKMSENSKPLYELVVTEYFTIESVLGTLGKETLTVLPDKQDIPVRTIDFVGHSGVRAGDYIQATIPRYQQRELENIFEPRGRSVHYFNYPRDFRSQESAIELVVLSKDKTVLRTDRSSNYDSFVKR